MKTNGVTRIWGTDAVGRLPLCVAFFLVADSFLISRAWFLEDNGLLLAMALPLSQCSLPAIWAACSGLSLYLRFAVPALGVVGCWYLLTQLLPWGLGEPASAAWALALTIQVLAITMAIQLYRLATNLTAQHDADANRPKRSRWSFDLRTLMLWTTVIAFGFGFIQFGRVQWLWTKGVADWEFLQAMPLIGVFNAVLAVLWLWAFATGNRQWRGRARRRSPTSSSTVTARARRRSPTSSSTVTAGVPSRQRFGVRPTVEERAGSETRAQRVAQHVEERAGSETRAQHAETRSQPATGSWRWRWRGEKIVIVVVLIGCLASCFPFLIDWATGTAVLEIRDTLVLAVAQSCLLAGSLAVTTKAPHKHNSDQ